MKLLSVISKYEYIKGNMCSFVVHRDKRTNAGIGEYFETRTRRYNLYYTNV